MLCVLLSLLMAGAGIFPAYAAESTCEVRLEVEKKLTGDRPSKIEHFSFLLDGKDNAPMPEEDTITISGAGTGWFPAITYTEPNDYHYTLREIPGKNKRYTYDNTVYEVTVQVTTDDLGNLSASVYLWETGSADKPAAAEFVNHYDAPDLETPKTGDDTHLTLWLSLSSVGLVGILGTLLLFRKKKQKDTTDEA